MPKSTTFRRFLTALKQHWKTALPGVVLTPDPPAPLRCGLTFTAGAIPHFDQRVYLDFQTTHRKRGHFTINLIIVDKDSELSTITILDHPRPGERLAHGGHRIGKFVGDQRHDKW